MSSFLNPSLCFTNKKPQFIPIISLFSSSSEKIMPILTEIKNKIVESINQGNNIFNKSILNDLDWLIRNTKTLKSFSFEMNDPTINSILNKYESRYSELREFRKTMKEFNKDIENLNKQYSIIKSKVSYYTDIINKEIKENNKTCSLSNFEYIKVLKLLQSDKHKFTGFPPLNRLKSSNIYDHSSTDEAKVDHLFQNKILSKYHIKNKNIKMRNIQNKNELTSIRNKVGKNLNTSNKTLAESYNPFVKKRDVDIVSNSFFKDNIYVTKSSEQPKLFLDKYVNYEKFKSSKIFYSFDGMKNNIFKENLNFNKKISQPFTVEETYKTGRNYFKSFPKSQNSLKKVSNEILIKNMNSSYDLLLEKGVMKNYNNKENLILKVKSKYPQTQKIEESFDSVSFEFEPKISEKGAINMNSFFDYSTSDLFELSDKIGKDNVLPLIGKEVLKRAELLDMINLENIDNFLLKVSRHYNNETVQYHNALHGTDVCLSSFSYFSNTKKNNMLNNIEVLSLIIASLGHDLGHPGLNNQFLINSKDDLAFIYHDSSILENFHIYNLFNILNENSCNIFSKFSLDELKSIKKKMCEEIISTDMALHKKVNEKFKEYINIIINEKNKESKESKEENRQSLLNAFIHFADLSHNTKKFEISCKWVNALNIEFWKQGDKEKELGLPISPLCDRYNVDTPKSQINFIQFVIMPSYELMNELFPELCYTMKSAEENIKTWKKIDKEGNYDKKLTSN